MNVQKIINETKSRCLGPTQGSQGDRSHNIDPACASVHTKTKGVRVYTTIASPRPTTQSTGARDHTIRQSTMYSTVIRDTNQSSLPYSRTHSVHHHGPANSAPLSSTRRSTMAPANSERHFPNGRDHLSVQSDICRQNQSIWVKLEGSNPGSMGYSDSSGGLPYSPHVSPLQPSPPCNSHLSTKEAAILEEEIQSLLHKQTIHQIPTLKEGFYFNW